MPDTCLLKLAKGSDQSIRAVLEVQPALYLDEVQEHLRNTYHVTFSICSISRALKRISWTKKVVSILFTLSIVKAVGILTRGNRLQRRLWNAMTFFASAISLKSLSLMPASLYFVMKVQPMSG